jgi:hypothetical protein
MIAHASHDQDGSILLEWIADDRRVGITIEIDPKESAWYYVCRDGTLEHGSLPAELLDIIEKARKWDEYQHSLHHCHDVEEFYADSSGNGG